MSDQGTKAFMLGHGVSPTDAAAHIDTVSETWRYISDWAERQRNDAQSSLNTHGLSLADTEYYRGQIEAYSALIGLPKQRTFYKAAPIR